MGVGKTCLVQRFRNGVFLEKQGTTIGVDFNVKTLVVEDKSIKLQVWDTGGQERFRTITQSYYRSAHGIVLCYDITCRQSFESLHRWIEDVSKFAVPNVAKVLVGTKADLEDRRMVEFDEGLSLSKAHNMIGFFEVSSKNNVNVDSVFFEMALQLKSQYDVGRLQDNGYGQFKLSYPETMAITGGWRSCCGL
uniref:Ras-related protein Rab-43 n=1 Tax=Bursaphelenchus xylophilus TaxID=6326 RepID=A0A1I7S3M1_BURXY